MIVLKNAEEIERMRVSAQMVSKTLGMLASEVKPGVTPLRLDQLAEAFIRDMGGVPGFLGMYGFPNSLCTSLNEQVVHGIPNDRPLEEGDIISIDCGVLYDEYYGDHAYTFEVGEVAPETKQLLEVTKASLYIGIEAMKRGNRVGDIGYAIQRHCESHGYGVVRELVGHGRVKSCTKTPKCPTTGSEGAASCCKTVWSSPLSP
jgi:methionyl aminopeptidase